MNVQGTQPRRVLVVDDDPRLLHIVAMFLGIEGFEVITAENGEQGLALLQSKPPDLVILDVMMPGLDGLDVCRQIRSSPATAQTPVLMFTALSGDDDFARAKEAGATDMITKPFNLVSLGSVVRQFFPEDEARQVPYRASA